MSPDQGERFLVTIPGSSSHKTTRDSESKVPDTNAANYEKDEATKEEIVKGFRRCLPLPSIISPTTDKLAPGKLAEEARRFFNEQSGCNTFAVVPCSELDFYPAPFVFIKVKLCFHCSHILSHR